MLPFADHWVSWKKDKRAIFICGYCYLQLTLYLFYTFSSLVSTQQLYTLLFHLLSIPLRCFEMISLSAYSLDRNDKPESGWNGTRSAHHRRAVTVTISSSSTSQNRNNIYLFLLFYLKNFSLDAFTYFFFLLVVFLRIWFNGFVMTEGN